MDESEVREQEMFDRRMAREKAERERVAALEQDAINRGKEIERLRAVLKYAREMTKGYRTGMKDEDRHKGAGNRLADAIAAYDASTGEVE